MKKIKIDSNKHYIGLLFINCKCQKIINNNNLNQVNVSNILINPKKEFLTIKVYIHNNFKYKKYIREYIKKTYNFKNKNIIEIKLINTFNRLHNYLIVIDKIKYINEGECIVNIPYNSNDFGWNPFIDFYKTNVKNISENDIYKLIFKNYNNNNYPKIIFKSNLVYKNFIIEYKQILQILCNIIFN